MKSVILTTPAPNQPPRLLDQLRRCIRDRHYSGRTKQAYVYWARWYIRFHYFMERGAREVQAFMSFLVNERHVAGATYSQALCAQLRIKDVDFRRREITVREGKGGKFS